ncbi:MAG: hypothetical protein FWG34_10240 [Oscillospiraceae bacterium]|nr:hypothetical protein [Oscillospiraceae bacterium]
MKTKKIFLILAAALLLGLFAVSCGKDEGGGAVGQNEGQKADETKEEVPEIENETEKLLPNVPEDKDFGGHEFTFLGNSTAYNPYWYSKDLYVEEETGDAIQDAVYYRNRAIEEKYNIKITAALSGSQYNDAKKSINSADGTYDVFSVPLQGATAQLAQDGSLLDLKNIPYIDLGKPWWDQRANEQLSIGHKLMFTISDLLIIDKDALFIFLFNKDVIQDQGLENPYKLVKEGKWTIDQMWDMAKDMPKDIDGDGKMTGEDSYRLLTAAHTIHGNVVSSGHFVITKDSGDMPVLNIADPVILASYEKWIEIINNRDNTWVAQDWASKHADIWMYQLDVLSEKRGLWLYAGMDRVTTLRTYDFNFGILPNPKNDESQKDYYNHVHAWCTTAISVPTTAEPERTGIILEALTAESYYTLRPTYYEISLKTKFLRDNESEEMLDLIFDTRCYDLGHVYNWGGVFDMFSNLPQQKNNTDFVSAYEKIMPKIEADMQKAIENFLGN